MAGACRTERADDVLACAFTNSIPPDREMEEVVSGVFQKQGEEF